MAKTNTQLLNRCIFSFLDLLQGRFIVSDPTTTITTFIIIIITVITIIVIVVVLRWPYAADRTLKSKNQVLLLLINKKQQQQQLTITVPPLLPAYYYLLLLLLPTHHHPPKRRRKKKGKKKKRKKERKKSATPQNNTNKQRTTTKTEDTIHKINSNWNRSRDSALNQWKPHLEWFSQEMPKVPNKYYSKLGTKYHTHHWKRLNRKRENLTWLGIHTVYTALDTFTLGTVTKTSGGLRRSTLYTDRYVYSRDIGIAVGWE